MAGMLFDTPGLTIASTPVATKLEAKKRKRASDVSSASPAATEAAAAVNLGKLMKRMRQQDGDSGWAGNLGGGGKTGVEQADKDSATKSKKLANKAKAQEVKRHAPTTKAPAASPKTAGPQRFKPEKKTKTKKVAVPAYSPASAANRTWAATDAYASTSTLSEAAPVSHGSTKHAAPTNRDEEDEDEEAQSVLPQTAMQKSLRAKLAGGKFRLLNEKLYTSTGQEARETMQEEGAFDDYHAGFRSQSAHWPVHPLALLTKSLSTLPANSLIVDFGAGDAQLARDLATPPLALKVISFDLVSKDGWVVVAECGSVPLPGNGGKLGGGEVVDVVVCCLSLMGTDWIGMVREARRILKVGGQLKIAEVTSRFTDLEGFVNLIKDLGFKSVRKDTTNTHFVLFDFVKLVDAGEITRAEKHDLTTRSLPLLKPCIYKKR